MNFKRQIWGRTPCSMDRRKELSMTEHRRWRDQRQKMGGRRGEKRKAGDSDINLKRK